MRPVPFPQLPEIARTLPADTASEITRLADGLSFTTSDVLIEVANAVTGRDRTRQPMAAHLAAGGFPGLPQQLPPTGGLLGPRRYTRPRLPQLPGHSK